MNPRLTPDGHPPTGPCHAFAWNLIAKNFESSVGPGVEPVAQGCIPWICPQGIESKVLCKCVYNRFRHLYELEVTEQCFLARVLTGEEPRGISRCVQGGGRSMLRPLHDVTGAGEAVEGLGRTPRPTYGILESVAVLGMIIQRPRQLSCRKRHSRCPNGPY